ncbi:hypothetical protein CSUI_008429 [Cystoisospora suis]|uniref:Uncharacterized protein n=1 Tax=Cystoisospora suis TaxID=483139 RepID=A0A2C6KMY0_9APIC|nr:hypothetical protein CSUI_008429 [Cystoisospora suis]
MISSSPGGGHSLSESQDLRWRQFLGAGGGDDTVAEVAGAPAVGGGRVEMAAPSRSSFPSSSLEGSNSGLSYASRGGGRETTGGCQESAFAGTAREDRLERSDGEGRRSGEDEWKEMLTYLGERLDVSKLHSAEWGTSRGGGLGWRGSSDEVFSDVSFQKTGGNYAESSQGTAPGRRSLEMTSNRPGPEGQGTGAFGMSSCPSSNSVLSHRILKEGVFRKSADAFDTYKCVGGGPGGAGGRSGFANSASGDLFGSSSFRASQERLSPVTRTPSDHARSVPWCVQASSSEGLLLRAGDEPTRSFGTEELAAGDLEASLMTVAATRSGQRLVYVGGERTVEELRMTSLSPRREQLLLRLGSEGLAGGYRSSLGSAHCQEGGRGLHGLLCERTAATERERLLPLLRPAARREQEERTDAVKAPFPELTWTDRILGGAREDQTTEG